jgi:hypothetical protein
MKIQALLHLLLEHPILYQLSWDKITEFIDIIRILKPDLCRLQASYTLCRHRSWDLSAHRRLSGPVTAEIY